MALDWIAETPPRWDADKERIIGGAPSGSLPDTDWSGTDVLPGEWWRVERDGTTVGYGWLDSLWGDSEILLVVSPEGQGGGVGSFIVDRLEAESLPRGMNYLYNVVRPDHPERERVTAWLRARGFVESSDGQLRKRIVVPDTAGRGLAAS